MPPKHVAQEPGSDYFDVWDNFNWKRKMLRNNDNWPRVRTVKKERKVDPAQLELL